MEQRESLEIVIFRHLAWRPERFQLQLKKEVSRLYRVEWEPPHWAARPAVRRGAANFKMPAALRPSSDRSRGELFALRQAGKFETFSPT
jgi:hypothetical protein